ncbi:hypothetical protein OIU78_007155 [Salix suchowensis]|uniref:Uncharacterized protein n=1 Tax=Salix purpurea TaxID=77065 RepID=A0A9Q0Z954_SALPP|nr:hypothetical protein OIU78_007155 [Salix suchowensis]KAJ6726089.1 hypothetical protein OIU79_004283 [Salix purpurea]
MWGKQPFKKRTTVSWTIKQEHSDNPTSKTTLPAFGRKVAAGRKVECFQARHRDTSRPNLAAPHKELQSLNINAKFDLHPLADGEYINLDFNITRLPHPSSEEVKDPPFKIRG